MKPPRAEPGLSGLAEDLKVRRGLYEIHQLAAVRQDGFILAESRLLVRARHHAVPLAGEPPHAAAAVAGWRVSAVIHQKSTPPPPQSSAVWKRWMASAKTTAANRQQPNVLVTGTPGTGKTTLAAQLAERTGFEHINVAELVKARGLHDGYDAEFDTLIMDEDKVCDELEVLLGTGGKVVDHHSCDFFPERWFDVVAVLQTDNTVLYDRLSARGYAQVTPARARPARTCAPRPG